MSADMKKIKGWDTNTLKVIAVLTMVIDHVGAALIWQVVASAGENYHVWHMTYKCMRLIGRIAFPIYCFMIVEGAEHTRDIKKYILRLLFFAVVSEIPFDYAIFGHNTWEYQNVFFTLAIGLLCIWSIEKIEEKINIGIGQMLLKTCVIFLAVYLAEFLKTDYDSFGVFIIVVLYLFRKNRLRQCLIGAVGFCWEITAPLAFLPIYFYNGQRGKKINKYVFYLIYPLHLVLLALLRRLWF